MLGKIKRHWWQYFLAFIGLLVLVAAYLLIRPGVFLPHKRIVLRVPYSLNDQPASLIPMGEKIYHPNAPGGHPGIDFQWASPDSKVLASADGKITSIRQKFDKWNKWEIDVSNGPYVVRYTEMESYNPNLKQGQHVNVGDFIGHPANPKLHNVEGAYQIHWEFGTPSMLRDRFCPMIYFDAASRQSVQSVYDKTNWQYKPQYPNICNGAYANKIE